MKKINILNLTTSFVIGGAEKVILDLILSLDKDKFNASIIALSEHDDMLDEYLSQGIKAKKLDMGKNISDFYRVYIFLSNYIVENKIDILHAHLTHTLPFLTLLKIRHPKLKIVFTSHNTNVGGKHRELMIWLSKPFRNADIVFNCTELSCDTFTKESAKGLSLPSSGSSCRSLIPTPSSGVFVGYAICYLSVIDHFFKYSITSYVVMIFYKTIYTDPDCICIIIKSI